MYTNKSIHTVCKLLLNYAKNEFAVFDHVITTTGGTFQSKKEKHSVMEQKVNLIIARLISLFMSM